MKLEEERRGTDNLFTIKGVDFLDPWTSVVPQVNIVLKANRYETLKSSVPYHFIQCNLDSPHAGEGVTFDPLHVHYDLLHEDFDPKSQAIARLGLQAVYWKKLYDGLSPLRHIPGFGHDNWLDFSCIPVFVKGGTSHLYIKPDSTGVSSIHYGGDGDMIGYAGKRAMRVSGEALIPFREIGVFDESLDKYIILREKMKQAENRAQINAISRLKQNHEVWERLRLIYPGVDAVFADNLILETPGVDRPHSFMFLKQAHELVSQLLHIEKNTAIPHGWDGYFQDMILALAGYLYSVTRPDYRKELLFDADFNKSLYRLGELMDGMYQDALVYTGL